MSYENKMLQLKQMLGKNAKKSEKPTFKKPEKPSYIDAWEKAGLSVIENDFGVLFKREVHYPLDYKHGNYSLNLFFQAIEKWQETDVDHPFAIDFEEQIIFFDTETTGLKGVGTHIFLIGLLETNEEYFKLTQYVLADPSNEAAFLFESKFWQYTKTIVTYNGKSFDWPQLETRWVLNQQILPKLRDHRQIDLLHSTKRIWKNNLDKMKLTKVEEEKLGFKRVSDIPGFLAPIIYTDAVKSGNPTQLMKVLLHNEWDLLSLITLYIRQTELLFELITEEAATTYTNIGKWFGDLKQNEQSTQVLENVTNHFSKNETGLAYFYLACQQKKNKQYNDAAYNFKKALEHIPNREKLKALEQLAILQEHQFKNYEQALYYSTEGLKLIQNNTFLKEEQQNKQISLWRKRVERVNLKLNRK